MRWPNEGQLSAVKLEHVKTTIRLLTKRAQIHDLTFRPVNPLLQPRLKKCLTHTRSQQSVYSKIHQSNEVQLEAVKLEHLLTIIT